MLVYPLLTATWYLFIEVGKWDIYYGGDDYRVTYDEAELKCRDLDEGGKWRLVELTSDQDTTDVSRIITVICGYSDTFSTILNCYIT